jgi:hypothetical protein
MVASDHESRFSGPLLHSTGLLQTVVCKSAHVSVSGVPRCGRNTRVSYGTRREERGGNCISQNSIRFQDECVRLAAWREAPNAFQEHGRTNYGTKTCWRLPLDVLARWRPSSAVTSRARYRDTVLLTAGAGARCGGCADVERVVGPSGPCHRLPWRSSTAALLCAAIQAGCRIYMEADRAGEVDAYFRGPLGNG